MATRASFWTFLNVCFSYSIGFTGVCAAKHCEHIIHIVRRNSDGVIECVIGAVDVKIVALLGVHARQGLLLRETVAAADAPKAHGFIRKNGDHTAAKAICTGFKQRRSVEHDDLCIFICGNLLFETR